MRVLIVEDEALIAMHYEVAVEEAGFEVVGVAADAAEALALATRERPDAALVDMNLRDGPSGNEVALALHDGHGVCPVFVTANLAMVSPEAKAVCCGLLHKPVPPTALVSALRAVAAIRDQGSAPG